MSAIAALKGYRTQFLYSLHYILSNKDQSYSYRLEGEEDLDVLDQHGQILYAIQVKNLSKTLSLSDLISQNKTSFLKRFIDIYPNSKPVLVSFGTVSEELKRWKDNPNHIDSKERAQFQKSGITDTQIPFIKSKLQINEVKEDRVTEEILDMLKAYQSVDPEPTAENLLYYIQYTAEKQQLITAHDLLESITRMGVYLSERISYTNQYGIYISPLVKTELSEIEAEKLKAEFYYGISARYEHIYAGLDVQRDHFLQSIDEGLNKHNIVIINGASGQGKSSLAYRYVFNKAAGSLIYEINLQEDPVKTNEAIVAISALTKGLKVPAYFILHVTPNTISWLKIAREFGNHPFLRLLVSIRMEDWYRAQSSELDFLYSDVELELAEEEAKEIFDRLEDRQLITTHNDFKDAWVEFKTGVPLLEFIHGITQGSSLRDKLKAQVAQLTKEETESPTGQLDLLRMVSLADAYGARIDATLIRDIPNVKLILDKFEKEYLLKHSTDRKYLTGLHPIRSMVLVEILFDEFIVCRRDYVSNCLKRIEQEDAYAFMLQSLYQRVITTEELITDLKASGRNTWIFYGAATRSLLWAGIRQYIDNNQLLLDGVYEKCGDAWSIVTDIYHGNTLDLEAVLDSLPNDNQELLNYLRETSQRLSPKLDVYHPAISFFDQIDLPSSPKTYAEWREFGVALFWLSNTSNKTERIVSLNTADFKTAFEILDSLDLATLMLGMYHYSEQFNIIRLELAPVFNEKLREEYQIPLLQVAEEVSFDFVVDVTAEVQPTSWHDRTMEVIDLLRIAYPEKTKYCSQGYGHRLDMMPLPYDDTTKHIPTENLPLPQWVNINATIRQLTDYPRRPDDWNDFHQRLNDWEVKIKTLLQNFRNSFNVFKKTGTFTDLLPVMEQLNYQSLSRLTAPKQAVDPMGIPIMTRKTRGNSSQDGTENKEIYLSEKYKPFFQSYNDYKTAIENFIRQSGDSTAAMIRKRSELEYAINDNIKRLSFINLYDAASKRVIFEQQRDQYFKKFSGKIKSVTDEELFAIASTWKSFWAAVSADDQKRIVVSEGITSLKDNFLNSLNRSIKGANKNANYKITYRNDTGTKYLPVFTIQVSDPIQSVFALRDIYNLVYEAIKGTEFISLKYMMLQRYFSKIYIISEIRGHVLDFKWFEFPLHLFLDTSFEQLPFYRLATQEIDHKIVSNLKLKSWISIHPGVQMIQQIATDFQKLRLYFGHLSDLSFFNDNGLMDAKGNTMVQKHFESVCQLLMASWQALINTLSPLAAEFPEDASLIDEEEMEYWNSLLEIIKQILPQKDEGKSINLDMTSIQEWSRRLADMNEKWGIFILLLQRKVLLPYDNS